MSKYIDFHIEISSLLHFVNEQIELDTLIPIKLISAILNSNSAPIKKYAKAYKWKSSAESGLKIV